MMTTKSVTKVDETVFNKIIDLTAAHSWLLTVDKALEHLVSILSETTEEQELLFELIDRFVYFSGDDMAASCQAIEKCMTSTWGLKPENTLIAPLHNGNDQFADSSQMFCQNLKSVCAWNGFWDLTRFRASVPKALKAQPEPENVVLVDEFIGTGSQALGVLAYAQKVAAEMKTQPNIFVASVVSMQASLPLVTSKVSGFFSTVVLQRGISDFYSGAALTAKRNAMEALESRLLEKRSHDRLQNFGYQRSEALYKYQLSTTADNVFPVFHWRWMRDGSVRPTLISPRF